MGEYGVVVQYWDNGTWSKGYTYKSAVPFQKGDIVVVPVRNFYAAAKVYSCTENYEFKSGINYKNVIQKVNV